MKSRSFVPGAFVLVIVLISALMTGCGNRVSKTNTNPFPTETKVEQATQAVQKTLPKVIYVADISLSLKGIDRYSLSENGELLLDTYVFDSNCQYYNAKNELVSFNEFATSVNDAYKTDQTVTKCQIINDEDKHVSQISILK